MAKRAITILLTCILLSAALVLVIEPAQGAEIIVDASGGGDWTHPYDAIANATAGDTIMIKNGRYDISDSKKLVIDKALTIEGESKDGVFLEKDGYDNTIEIPASGVNLRNFHIAGGYSTLISIRASDVTLEDIEVNDTGYSMGVDVDGAEVRTGIVIRNVNTPGKAPGYNNLEGALIEDCLMGGYFGSGASFTKTNNTVVNNCIIEKGGPTIDKHCTNLKFEGCTFRDHGNSFMMMNGQDNKVYNCTFDNITGDNSNAINLDGTTNLIVGNTFTGCGWGISVFDIANTVKYNNFVDNDNGAIIAAENWVGEGNFFACDDNWFGDASGPYNADLNPSGTGDKIGGNVEISDWLSSEATWQKVDGSVTPTPSEPTEPAAPVTLTANAGDGYVVLAWAAGNDGGAAITGYKIYKGTSESDLTLLTEESTTGYTDNDAVSYTHLTLPTN